MDEEAERVGGEAQRGLRLRPGRRQAGEQLAIVDHVVPRLAGRVGPDKARAAPVVDRQLDPEGTADRIEQLRQVTWRYQPRQLDGTIEWSCRAHGIIVAQSRESRGLARAFRNSEMLGQRPAKCLGIDPQLLLEM